MPRRFLFSFALAALGLHSSEAWAGAYDLRLNQLGNADGGAATGNNDAFRSLASELGVLMAPKPVDPADSLGLSGFAVSADLTAYEPEVHRRGSLWQAIRASAAIPGLLPPFYTDDGRMLVDGSVIANVPIDTMHRLKRGPNVVVSFDTGDRQQFPVDYASLPKRRELIWQLLNPRSTGRTPHAPSAATCSRPAARKSATACFASGRTVSASAMKPQTCLSFPTTTTAFPDFERASS